MVIWLERGADLHTAQLMPLPLTVSCFSEIQIGFTFLVPADPGSPGQRAVKRVCVCVCVLRIHKRQHFLNNTSAHYRLLSAMQIRKQKKNFCKRVLQQNRLYKHPRCS